ncbi:MAG: hypothetical protein WC755_08225 [Candidatus Woesearchaeota archaeon]|jgi:DNA-binding XRE family transcriptional regulator
MPTVEIESTPIPNFKEREKELVPILSGAEFKYIRKMCMISQREFGEFIEMSRQYVTLVEASPEVNPIVTMKLYKFINSPAIVKYYREKFIEISAQKKK